MKPNLENKALRLKAEFVALGFKRLNAFFYICKSLKVAVKGMCLINFWNFNDADAAVLLKIEAALISLKNE